jgi:mannosyl-3-phosphoglycerate phosphatase
MKKLLVFTDLDGSLLDHDSYSWQPAISALTALDEMSFPVVFSSSKTAAEIISLREETGNQHPFISENGAVVSIPVDYFSTTEKDRKIEQGVESECFAEPYGKIISLLTRLRGFYNYNFCGFNEMDIEQLVTETGLEYEQACNAKQRQASEPLLWKDTGAAFKDFKSHLENEGLSVTEGGRFIHVMSDVNKGKAVNWLKRKYQDIGPNAEWVTVGVGDSFNDIQMLKVVDYPVFISNAKTRQPDLSRIKNLITPQLPGPAGWNQAILSLMKKIL